MGPNFLDDIDCGSFFDHIEDLIEFPPENECGSNGSGDCKDFSSTWKDTLPETDPLFPGSNSNSASDLSTQLAVPYEDIVQLEWLSTFMEDSFACGGMTIAKENSFVNKVPCHNQFQTSSPVSVLESSSSSSSSSSSCSGGKTNPLSPSQRGPQRARSKRPRPATFNPRPAMKLISSTSSFTEVPQPFVALGESESFAESQPIMNVPEPDAPEQKKKKKIKLTFSSASAEMNQNPPAQAVRKCLHCEITKTPQWRTGPLGPKTLCNACGVRYKSGRLFPEYRPAASPTFVPSLHSNSHKKVIEMRNKVTKEGNVAGSAATTPTTTQPELIPNTNPSLE